ncbi:MAG: hypothetical protein AABZ30_05195 [Myxococcota bacterium]
MNHRDVKLAVAAAALLPLLAAHEALARKPEDAFKRQVVITTKRFPMRFASASAMESFLRSNRKEHIWPEKDGTWKFEFMSFFAEPLEDFMVTVKLFDVTGSERRQVTAYDENTGERGLRSLHSSITLEKPEFQPNRRYELVVTNRGRVLAQTKFVLRGQGEKYSGKVEFSDEETRDP